MDHFASKSNLKVSVLAVHSRGAGYAPLFFAKRGW